MLSGLVWKTFYTEMGDEMEMRGWQQILQRMLQERDLFH